jgi:hypothetical protein
MRNKRIIYTTTKELKMTNKTKRLNSLLKATEKMIELDEKELALEFIINARDLFHDEKLADDANNLK